VKIGENRSENRDRRQLSSRRLKVWVSVSGNVRDHGELGRCARQ
jgi:hypothetical protein